MTLRRPQRFQEFNGQAAAIQQLKIAVKSTKARNQLFAHTLLLGPPGTGKTSLAMSVLPAELGVECRMFNCGSVRNPQDILPTLTAAAPGSILFLDEIHALAGTGVFDTLLSLLEGSQVTIQVGEGQNKRLMTVQVDPYTVIAATTRESSLPEPVRDRFRHQIRLALYDDPSMAKVLEWTASQLSSSFTQAALESLVPACHGTARHAVRLVEASIDTVLGDDAFDGRSVEKIDKDVVDATLVRLGYKFGLSAPEFDLLVRLSQAPGGKLGLSTLASVLDEESKTVEQVYEPYLLQKGFMTKTTNGRQITEAGLALVR